MAKVTGPLFSIEARGKIADAMVHFPWKGLNVVRGWVKPANKKSEDQGDVRLRVGGLGRAMSAVDLNSDYWTDLLDLAEGTETWNSAFVKFAMLHIMTDATAYEAIYTAFEAHANKAMFTTAAGTAGLTDFDVDYKGTTHLFSKGMMYYMLARTAQDINVLHPTLFTGEPYVTALVNWNQTQVNQLIADLAG